MDYPVGHTTAVIPIHTTAADGSPVNPDGSPAAFQAADFLLYKDGGTTQRTSTAGWTVRSPHDSEDGLHSLIIDLSENTHAGFYAGGHTYQVALKPAETVDGIAVKRWVGAFSIDLLGLQASLAALAAYVDTEVAAILAAVDTEVGSILSAATAIKATTDKLDETLEDDSGVYRFSERALELAPTGGGGGASAAWQLGTALAGFEFVMRQTANPGLGAPGLTVTAQRFNGSTFEACENTPVGIANGSYVIDFEIEDGEASGTRCAHFRFSAATALDNFVTIILSPAAE